MYTLLSPRRFFSLKGNIFSCVTTIEECLLTLSPRPLSVQVSIALRSVTVHHFKALSPRAIRYAIEDAGFDVIQNPSEVTIASSASQYSVEEKVDKHPDVSLTPPISAADVGPFFATFSVGGMTCSACSNAITCTISELAGVSKVTVSVLERFATAVIERKELADVVCEAVDDCGFEAQVISVESVNATDVTNQINTRTVSLRVDGMFCQ